MHHSTRNRANILQSLYPEHVPDFVDLAAYLWVVGLFDRLVQVVQAEGLDGVSLALVVADPASDPGDLEGPGIRGLGRGLRLISLCHGRLSLLRGRGRRGRREDHVPPGPAPGPLSGRCGWRLRPCG